MENGWQLLSVTTLAAAISGMAGSALILALPSIMVEFHVNLIYTLWIIISYLIALVSVLTIIGAVTDRIGRANTFRIGIIIFTIFFANFGILSFTALHNNFQGISGSWSSFYNDEFKRNGN